MPIKFHQIASLIESISSTCLWSSYKCSYKFLNRPVSKKAYHSDDIYCLVEVNPNDIVIIIMVMITVTFMMMLITIHFIMNAINPFSVELI